MNVWKVIVLASTTQHSKTTQHRRDEKKTFAYLNILTYEFTM